MKLKNFIRLLNNACKFYVLIGDEFKDHPRGPSPLSINASADLEPMLKSLFHLHLLARIEADLSWFLIKGLLSEKTGNQVLEVNRRLCNDIAPHALNLIDAFGNYSHFDMNFRKHVFIVNFF